MVVKGFKWLIIKRKLNKKEIKMNNENKIANPGPLGLLGFGMTTILLNLVSVGLLDFTIVIIAMGIAVGGLAQVVAGIFEFKRKSIWCNRIYCVWFFWLSFVIIKQVLAQQLRLI